MFLVDLIGVVNWASLRLAAAPALLTVIDPFNSSRSKLLLF